MNTTKNSYTPIYIVQEPTLVKSFVVNKSNDNLLPPKTNSLKTYYEQSGNLEKSLLLNNVETKLQLLKKQEFAKMGNNVKWVTVLKPSSYIKNNSHLPNVNNIVTPTVTSSVAINRNFVPNNGIVNNRITLNPRAHSNAFQGNIWPKIRPKADNITKLVKSEKLPIQTACTSVDKARIVYRLVPSSTGVRQNETIVEGKQKEIRRNVRKTEHKERIDEDLIKDPADELTTKKNDPVVTRSGRTIKSPKQMLLEETPQKPKRKNGTTISHFECSNDINNVYRLQKHNESQHTHLPGNTHMDLFNCLLEIINNKPEHERAQVFIEQLEHIIRKIKSLLPSLLKEVNEDKENICNISEDVGGLFGIMPGKHNFNIHALTCVNDKNSYCRHRPTKSNCVNLDNEEFIEPENEVANCARVNTVHEWPIVNKRIWKVKQQKSKNKKIKASLDISDTHIDLGSDIFLTEANNINLKNNVDLLNSVSNDNAKFDDNTQEHIDQVSINKEHISIGETQNMQSNSHHTRFHSAHFDIRSSPIKVSQSTVFHKFQINPQQMATAEMQVRPLTFENNTNNTEHSNNIMMDDFDVDLEAILKEIDIPTKVIPENNNLKSDNSIQWTQSTVVNYSPLDDFLFKSNSVKSDTDINSSLSNNSKENLPTEACMLYSNSRHSLLNQLEINA